MTGLLARLFRRADDNLDWGRRHLELAIPSQRTLKYGPCLRADVYECCSHCPRPCFDVHRDACPDCQAVA